MDVINMDKDKEISGLNNLEFKKAAEKLEFLVVEDIYSDTETLDIVIYYYLQLMA